jgi:lysophospholipase L1-like esterase
MSRKSVVLAAAGLALALLVTGIAAYCLLGSQQPERIRVACIGDSLTQSSEYPYELWSLIGNQSYDLRNFGAGSTTVLRSSETPYMNTSIYSEALEYRPNIVIIMLGTNDAQPSLHSYNHSFTTDYTLLINSFLGLESKPEVWVVLPPPIISNQSGAIDSAYFDDQIIPGIMQAANQTGMPVIDVHSAFAGHSEYYKDGLHVNSAGANAIADTVYRTIFQ